MNPQFIDWELVQKLYPVFFSQLLKMSLVGELEFLAKRINPNEYELKRLAELKEWAGEVATEKVEE